MQDELPTIFDKPVALKQPRTFSRLIPQISLMQLMLIVVILGLLAAYYAKIESTSREIEKLNVNYHQQLSEIESEHRVSKARQSFELWMYRQISEVPDLSNRCLFVDSGYFHSRKNPFRIYAYLDPSQITLLKVAYQNISLNEFPIADETYAIPAIGDNGQNRNVLRFDVFFNGDHIDYDSILPFKGSIQVLPYNYSIRISADNKIKTLDNIIKRNFSSVNLTFDKPKRQLGWFEFLLETGRESSRLRIDQPNQILRFRTEPESTETCPGILLWLEVVPKDTNIEGIKRLDDPN